MRGRLCAVLLAVVIFLCTGCISHAPTEDDLTVLTIATADSGGTMYPVGSAIADRLSDEKIKINVSASTGSAMNVQNLLDGEVDLALVSGDVAYDHLESTEGSLRAIAAVYISQSNWIAPASSVAVYVHDLKGLRIGVGPQGSSSELAAQAALDRLGLTDGTVEIQNCGLGAGGDLVLSGELDAIHGFSGAPINGLSELADQMPCRILRYTTEELDSILNFSEVYCPVTLPAKTYTGQQQDIQTFGVKCLLCVNESMDEDIVYRLAQAMWENRDGLEEAHPAMEAMCNGKFLYEDLPIPLHPGAEKFYAELDGTV